MIITVNTEQFKAVHQMEPSGTRNWWFELSEPVHEQISFFGSFEEAREQVVELAHKVGCNVITVCTLREGNMSTEDEDRKSVLLRAAYDMLTKCKQSLYVESPLEMCVFYDDADCDGYCLCEDIAYELGISVDTPPIEGFEEEEEGESYDTQL